ncbi:MAG: cobyrinate a,c-diamide synthase, partial [Thermodesulforhabdaceae bacterium]
MKKSGQQKCPAKVRKPVGFVIAAAKGGAGKTVITVGLVAAFKSFNFKAVPFKKGPDYIDAGWLASAAGSPCYNLDPFLMTPEDILASFYERIFSADVVVVEGNRGLFDGLDAEGSCSTAELAKLLNLPVVLVVDVTKMTRSTAALVYGFKNFDDVSISGVILNKVGTVRQERVIKEAIEKTCSIPVVGAIPRLSKNFFPERHLGLVPTPEHNNVVDAIDHAKKIVCEYVDLEKILTIAKEIEYCGVVQRDAQDILYMQDIPCDAPTIGVMRDEAFQFYYPENLEALEKLGARLVFFSAIEDEKLPSDVDAIYIGGGFPEVYADVLSKNESIKKELREAIENEMPVYAECGGLMYLSQGIRMNDTTFPMVGVFPFEIEMCKKPQGHGYVIGDVISENPFLPQNYCLKGHEFHYSRAVWNKEVGNIKFVVKLKKGY